MNSIADQVLAILAEYSELEPGQLGAEQSLDQLGIDSLSLVEIIFDIEDRFDISIPDEAELAQQGFSLQHVKDIQQLVSSLVGEKA